MTCFPCAARKASHLGFHKLLGRRFRAASSPDEAVNESWKVYTTLQAQVLHAPVVCSLPSYEQQHHNLLEIHRGTLALSASIHNFPRSNVEFVITAAHRHTPLTKKTLGAFLDSVLWEVPISHYRAPRSTSPAQHWRGVTSSSDMSVR